MLKTRVERLEKAAQFISEDDVPVEIAPEIAPGVFMTPRELKELIDDIGKNNDK